MKFGALLTVVAIGLLLSLVALFRYAGTLPKSHLTAPIPSVVVEAISIAADATQLDVPAIEQIGGKIIEGLAAKLPRTIRYAWRNPGQNDPNHRHSETEPGHTLEREVQDLCNALTALAIDTQPIIERSLASVLPNGLRP